MHLNVTQHFFFLSFFFATPCDRQNPRQRQQPGTRRDYEVGLEVVVELLDQTAGELGDSAVLFSCLVSKVYKQGLPNAVFVRVATSNFRQSSSMPQTTNIASK